jgi:uncharacterized protein (TIGR02679 family)
MAAPDDSPSPRSAPDDEASAADGAGAAPRAASGTGPGPGTTLPAPSAPGSRAAAVLAGPGYRRLWERCRAVLERSGPAALDRSSVSLAEPTDTELAAVSALLGRQRRAGRRLVVALADADRALRSSGLGVGLVDWLESMGGPLRDRAAERAARQAGRAELTAAGAAHRLAGEAWFAPWLAELTASGLLTRLAPGQEAVLLAAALAVLDELPADDVALPVLAGTLTGDAKRLSHSALGTVVLAALAAWAGVDRPATATARRALWARHGVRWDDVSSHVLVLGVRPTAGETAGMGRWLVEAAEAGEPFRLTLRQLAGPELSFGGFGVVHVCENPAVVVEAANRFGAEGRALVCTEGMPGDAFWALADRLARAGCELRYHGDFDWAGLRIAGAVIARCGAVPWRFGAVDYEAAVRSFAGPSDALPRLGGAPAASPWDPALAAAMAARGVAVHEETVIATLLADLAPPE